jgi:phytoene synthase
LFAAREMRGALLGVYALMAEWQALMDPGTEAAVARIKLAWWHEEIGRLRSGIALHPITRYLADFPTSAATDLAPLLRSVEAAASQIAGAPLEHGAQLESHADALFGAPLLIGALLGGARGDHSTLRACVAALAAGQYLAHVLRDYGREARAGRVPFAVDELLTAGIDNEDLAAGEPPAHLQSYLARLRQMAADYFASASAALAPEERSQLRHLRVLATLGAGHLNDRKRRPGADFRLTDLYNAWSAARRAAAAR